MNKFTIICRIASQQFKVFIAKACSMPKYYWISSLLKIQL